MKTKEIWEKILLKKVYGYELTNTVTIEKNEQNNKRKYQVFEVLVAETLALLDTKTKWETTCGNNDQGVDIVGSRKAECTTPFLSNVPEQLYLGQIKRRNKGYRYDDFRNDINKLFEFYSSKVLYKDATLMQLIFVISSDNENNIKNLQKNLSKDILYVKNGVLYRTTTYSNGTIKNYQKLYDQNRLLVLYSFELIHQENLFAYCIVYLRSSSIL